MIPGNVSKSLRPSAFTSLLTALLAAFALPLSGRAAPLVSNGDFSSNGGAGQVGFNTTLSGWTADGVIPSTANPPVYLFPSTGGTVTGDSHFGSLSFYGLTAPPTGSWFAAVNGDIALDGGIDQTVSGLKIGDTYAVTFDWAAAQATGNSSDTSLDHWGVDLGTSPVQYTTATTISGQNFSGWQSATLDFTATSTSEDLAFYALGSSNAQPWLLLNNVKMVDTATAAVPEPGTALFGAALSLAAIVSRRRRVSADAGGANKL
jgi:hypothetical protein